MSVTIAFDVYGTLIDTHGVVVMLQRHLGDRAAEFSRCWREKQLEYSFRRALMQNYQTFAVCTSQALDYACTCYKVALSQEQKQELLDAYRVLPAFSDVEQGLRLAQQSGFRLYAFSNGSREAVEKLLATAGIRDFFLDVVSVDEMKSFKPNPGVYCHFLRRAGSVGKEAWLVSSNPFDVLGADSAGLRTAWLQRSPEAIFDPWGSDPTVTITSLVELASAVERQPRLG
ncbi:haloacid dehalogenase [Geomonas silvestris]|uniref:Haloacid dehalogenase n=1 Tax=Geomonas silvestris TaxID=2740184 RepID=A0A6V8MKF1_9BACT|nr:haloacid dehalogenase type II [Geomonas silvestris]GFO60404.1 haloacid dehalogenase [Geomonas silvestris]